MKKIKFLRPAFSFLIIALLITTVSRIVLFFIFANRVMETENYGLIFPIGLRMDLILICYLLLLPVLLIVLLPEKWILKLQRFINGYFIFFLAALLFFELATPDFIFEYDTRPNKLFLDYLIYPKEVLGTLFKGYLASIVITFVALVARTVHQCAVFAKRVHGQVIGLFSKRNRSVAIAGYDVE